MNIRHRGGRHDGADISFPATVLVDETGTVRWTYQSDTYRQRARPEEVFTAIAAMTGVRSEDVGGPGRRP